MDDRQLIERVRSTCRDAVHADATLGQSSTLALSALTSKKELAQPIRLPLRFSRPADEINTLVLLHVLETAGLPEPEVGFRGVLCLHLMGRPIDATALCSFTVKDVPDVFGFEPGVEVALMPGVYEMKPGPLHPLAERIVSVMNKAGQAVLNRGHDDFFAFVKSGAASEARVAAASLGPGALWRPSAVSFVQRLADAIAPFKDVVDLDGRQVWLLSAAQACAARLHARFSSELPELFGFHDLDALTVSADVGLAKAMRRAGAIALPEDASEAQLRAAAVVAGAALATEVRGIAAAALAGHLDSYVTGAGRPLTPEEAAPILAAVGTDSGSGASSSTADGGRAPGRERLARFATVTEVELGELVRSEA